MFPADPKGMGPILLSGPEYLAGVDPNVPDEHGPALFSTDCSPCNIGLND